MVNLNRIVIHWFMEYRANFIEDLFFILNERRTFPMRPLHARVSCTLDPLRTLTTSLDDKKDFGKQMISRSKKKSFDEDCLLIAAQADGRGL